MLRIFTSLLIVLFFTLTIKAQTSTSSFTFDNVNREYTLHVPSIYNANTSVPLIISLHGLGDNMANFSNVGFHGLSETENFIVVTPQALDFAFSGFSIGTSWNSGVGAEVQILSEPIYPNENIDDVGFISALIDSLSLQYNIDPDRIYATGFSMGGFMSNRLAVELNDRIAAIASVSGTLGDNVSRDNNPCPIPVMHIHGTADATIDYNADYSTSGGLYTIVGDSVSGLMNFWNGVNQTDVTAIHDPNYATVGGGLVVEEFIWENGQDSSMVRHLKVNGGGHEWFSIYPGEIWDFLSVHKNQEECVISGISRTPSQEKFSIYPNPSKGNIYVTVESTVKQIQLFDVTSKLLLSSRNNILDLESLQDGIYYVQIQTEKSILKQAIVKR